MLTYRDVKTSIKTKSTREKNTREKMDRRILDEIPKRQIEDVVAVVVFVVIKNECGMLDISLRIYVSLIHLCCIIVYAKHATQKR